MGYSKDGREFSGRQVRGGQLRALDGTLEDADLMAQSEDFQFEARHGSETKRRGRRTRPLERARNGKRWISDNSQFINLIGDYERHSFGSLSAACGQIGAAH